MASYYLNENGDGIRPELLESEAEKQAQKFSRLNTTQLRKFFNEVKALEKKLKDNNDSDEYFNKNLIPLIKMLKAKVSYSLARQEKKDFQQFKDFEEFLKRNIDNIKNKQDFKFFVLHFEAVIGYYYYYNKNLNKII